MTVKNIFLLAFLLITTTRGEITIVPTFECLSLYFPSEDRGDCHIYYKQSDETIWQQALDLVYDSRDGEYRGSIVNLKPGTHYDVRLGNEIFAHAETLSETFPIGPITIVESSASPLTIAQSGTPDGWHLVCPAESSHVTIDVRNSQDYTAVIDADYVIVRGLEFKNAAVHGILIKGGRRHIVIEECHITFWGRIGGTHSFGNEGNYDSAIYAEEGTGNLIVQRNLIENPRGCSNSWETGHPGGPQAVSLFNSIGGNIIRYNDFLSTPDHSFNDIFGGGSNFSWEGSPNRDSDIYGNIFRSAHDDAIESEGANMNVRIWGNYIHDVFQFIATASTSKGPLYIFRNVFGEARSNRKFLGGALIKTGMRAEFGGGRKYVFHNTTLQPHGALHVFGSAVDPNCVTRNNIFHCAGRLASSNPVEVAGDYDYDLFTGIELGNAQEEHGIRDIPRYIESYYLQFYPTSTIETVKWGKIPVTIGDTTKTLTDPVVTIPNPVVDGGAEIPNFNDDFTGRAPDLGAFEVNRPPLKFGRHANGERLAPWEQF